MNGIDFTCGDCAKYEDDCASSRSRLGSPCMYFELNEVPPEEPDAPMIGGDFGEF